MTERAIVAGVLRRLRFHGAWAMKVHGSSWQMAGVPDVLACWQGRFLAIECKRPNKYPTKIQVAVLTQLEKAGAVVMVARAADDVEELLGSLAVDNFPPSWRERETVYRAERRRRSEN